MGSWRRMSIEFCDHAKNPCDHKREKLQLIAATFSGCGTVTGDRANFRAIEIDKIFRRGRGFAACDM